MFTKSLFITSLLFALPIAGCNQQAAPEQGTYPGTLNSEALPNFDDAESCDIETPCPSGLACLYVDALDLDTPICVDDATICDAINCGDGECLLLESYPGRVMCSSGTPGGGDENCTIDNEGNTSCPDEDEDPDDSEGSEPGGPPGN